LSLWQVISAGGALFILLNDKIGEAKFVWVGLRAANCRLNEGDGFCLLQSRIAASPPK
jgi:hypothetical protein